MPCGLGATAVTTVVVDVELLQALRRMVVSGSITADRAEYVREDLSDLPIRRYPHEPLAERMWAMRDDVTAYDAAFVALAQALGASLVTCDARLATAPGHAARVELFGAD